MPTDLENILSGEGAPAPAPEPTPAPVQETKADDLPVPNEQVADAEAAEPQADERGMVPLAALQESRTKVKRYTEQVADFERKLKEVNEQNERRFNDLVSRLQPQQPPQQQQEPPDFWADPQAAIRHMLAPVIGELKVDAERRHDVVTRAIAEQAFGADKIAEAEATFINAVRARQVDPADYARIEQAPNRYAACLDWHKKQAVLSELQSVGGDPAKYREKLKAEALAELQQQGGQAPAGNGAAPVFPTNLTSARNVGVRSGPAWSGPAPLADIFARGRPK